MSRSVPEIHSHVDGTLSKQPANKQTTPVLYDCFDEIIAIVTSIMNKSSSFDIVPQCFKHVLVKPLLKKVSLGLSCLKHYCTVSNLSFLSKVLECIVLKQFIYSFFFGGGGWGGVGVGGQHLGSHSLLEPFKSAYRKRHSTGTALLGAVNDLLQASDSGCVSVLSLLDLSVAFNTTDHSIPITKLRATLGCSGLLVYLLFKLPYQICVCWS